jgi:hypothetical protein
MLKIILQVLFLVLVFRLVGSLIGLFRGGSKRKTSFSPSESQDAVDKPDYSEITPYEIEDAEYEELPKQE